MSKINLTKESLEKCISEAYLNYHTIYGHAIEDYLNVRNRPRSNGHQNEDEENEQENDFIVSDAYLDKITTEKLNLALNAAKGFDNLLKIMASLNKAQLGKDEGDKKVDHKNNMPLTDEIKEQIRALQEKNNKNA